MTLNWLVLMRMPAWMFEVRDCGCRMIASTHDFIISIGRSWKSGFEFVVFSDSSESFTALDHDLGWSLVD